MLSRVATVLARGAFTCRFRLNASGSRLLARKSPPEADHREALMSRRHFLRTSALFGAATVAGHSLAPVVAGAQQAAPARPAKRPTRIVMGGYGPPSTGFSLALKKIGERLEARFGDEV